MGDWATMEAFRPDEFFVGRWRGWGVVRDALGRVRDRVTVSGEGAVDELRRTFKIQEFYAFEGGRHVELDWEIETDDEGWFRGTEMTTGAVAHGRQAAGEYRVKFSRVMPTVMGERRVLVDSRFTMVEPRVAIAHSRMSRYGLRFAEAVVCYRREG